MPKVTYYVVLPFMKTDDGLLGQEAAEMPSVAAAVSRAHTMAMSNAGAMAFARTGDPATGDFSDAEVLAKW